MDLGGFGLLGSTALEALILVDFGSFGGVDRWLVNGGRLGLLRLVDELHHVLPIRLLYVLVVDP